MQAVDTPSTPLVISYAGETLWLLPERALWWPNKRVLWIADIHLGKAATYRALGQPVPSGTTHENLTRLTRLLTHYRPDALVFLGDFLHAARARTPAVLSALTAWRSQHAAVHCTLVRGNHDQRAGDPPEGLNIEVVNEPFLMGPFAACHHPQTHATHAVIAGHLHPALHLRGPGRDHLRLPCFCFEPRLAILPAFGEFTGGWRVQPEPGRQLYPVGGRAVWRLPES
ncbi:MAG TPA: ligase-associated DNA damage response endonuclease PdeM [Polaromonas sp.]|uniref:ligase-associated DNA damage response endonuclease PdeM n=1 Tax=Polaromonas sp. TaxID=1869339 RepID=UPI002D40466E|nr:ligase-associated DNA damage response endonuclease PdeM [Polaromonas sp.]HYW57178.1 ligase-associated DNA damage response endonuclease PdeM [Polaromonas sp.]